MKKALSLLIFLPIVCFSITDEQKQVALNANIKYLKEHGFMTPDSGVHLVSAEKLKLSQEQKENIQEVKEKKELFGYIPEYSERANELLNIESFIQKRRSIDAAKYKPYESHLRANIRELKMAYPYKGVPHVSKSNSLGVAPVGTYLDGKGWTGAVYFFKEKNIGTCAYTENNLKVSHGAARILEDEATKDVNGKITLIDVSGTKKSGILYSIKWFDNSYIKHLECASPFFSKEVTKNAVLLAKKIDIA